MVVNPSLLLITWNRAKYICKTVERLLANPEPFKLYCWDNSSEAETADFIRELKDDRIVIRHFHNKNVNQDLPVRWFLDQTPDGLVGKIDDDVLLPEGWIKQLSSAVASSENIGMLSCWNFMPEDYLPEIAVGNAIDVNGTAILRTTSVGGCSFLAQRSVLRAYLRSPSKQGEWGIPIDRRKMTLDGLISGYPLPLAFAHHMDDPRSEHCLMSVTGTIEGQASLTARKMNFKTIDDYARWIRADAIRRQVVPFDEQAEKMRSDLFRKSLAGRFVKRIERLFIPS